VEDVLHLLDRRSIDAAHWVGLSAGGFVALRLALDHPSRTRSLTMVSGAAYLDQHTRAVLDRWWTTSAAEGREALAVRLLKDLYYPDWVEAPHGRRGPDARRGGEPAVRAGRGVGKAAHRVRRTEPDRGAPLPHPDRAGHGRSGRRRLPRTDPAPVDPRVDDPHSGRDRTP
ncbi:Alpha/beta hydrolase fold-1 domain protein, partial [mine drainage metagenome]